MEDNEGHPGLGGGGLLGSGSSGGGTSMDAVEAGSGQTFSKQAKNLAKNSTFKSGAVKKQEKAIIVNAKISTDEEYKANMQGIMNRLTQIRQLNPNTIEAKKYADYQSVKSLADTEFLVEFGLEPRSRSSYSSVLDNLDRLEMVRPASKLSVGLTGINDDLWALNHKVQLMGLYTGTSSPRHRSLRVDLQKRGYLGKWAGDPMKFGVSYQHKKGHLVRPDVPHIGDPYFALDPKQEAGYYRDSKVFIMPGAFTNEKYPGYMDHKPGYKNVVRHELAHQTSYMIERFAGYLNKNTPAMVSGPIIDFLRSHGLGKNNPLTLEGLEQAGTITKFLNLMDAEELLDRYEDYKVALKEEDGAIKNKKHIDNAQRYLGRFLNNVNESIQISQKKLDQWEPELNKRQSNFSQAQLNYLSGEWTDELGVTHDMKEVHRWSRVNMDEFLSLPRSNTPNTYDEYVGYITPRTTQDKDWINSTDGSSFLNKEVLRWQVAFKEVEFALGKINDMQRQLIAFESIPAMYELQMGLLEILDRHGIKLPDVIGPSP